MIYDWKWRALVVGILLLGACRPAVMAPPSGGVSAPPPVSQPPQTVVDELRRREQVAAALTEQGRDHLDEGRVDSAIRILEQALSQSPHYGPAYFYLAECWIRKNNGSQARAFHSQAALYLTEKPVWRDRLRRQASTIEGRFSGLSGP